MNTHAHSCEHIHTILDPSQNIVGFNYQFAKTLLTKLESLIEERRSLGSVGDLAQVVAIHLSQQIFQIRCDYYSVEELERLVATSKSFLAIFEKRAPTL